MKQKILFVCTGNICRSPMAEGIARQMFGADLYEIQSAGLAAPHGQPPSQNAVSAAKALGIDISHQRSKPLTAAMVRESDAIFVMTYSHMDMMLTLFPSSADKIFLAREFTPAKSPRDREVADPYGGSLDIYQKTARQLQETMPDILAFLKTYNIPDTMAKSHHSRVHIAIGADHGGVQLKTQLLAWLTGEGYHVTDFGSGGDEPVDYPDYASVVSNTVAGRQADFGILICKSGIGMSIAANKVDGVRAALVHSESTAVTSREHNDANVLCLSASETDFEQAQKILRVWLTTSFAGGHHEERVRKLSSEALACPSVPHLAATDPAVFAVVQAEEKRQSQNIELIASENFTSRAVMEAQGSCLTNKYAEGYPAKRWYGGCENVDVVERLAIDRAKEIFGADHANVQPHSGSQANMAVYFSVLQPGDKILTMDLSHGGHLTHGHKMNFSGRLFEVVHYGVSPETECIDYDALEKLALECKPRMITAGASAYSRTIDFARMRSIADSVGAYLFVDMAHIAGLVAAGVHPSPVPHADFVTSTTHKTLRGPRGGIILCREKYAKDIDSHLFPGCQGGPLMHVIAAKAVCFGEALQPAFKTYQQQVAKNARALCDGMKRHGYRIVSGTTDNHVMLVDLQPKNITGKDAQELLDKAGITVNKNAIPFDKQSPFKAGGIRLGSPAVTTRGFQENEMLEVADLIHAVLSSGDDQAKIASVRQRVLDLTSQYPLPS